MAEASIPVGMYHIPKPYGEIYSWRLYRRDQLAPEEHPLAYYFYSLSLFKIDESTLPSTRCEVRYTDKQDYILQHHDNTFYLVIQKSLVTPFAAGDWLSLENKLAFTTDLGAVFPLVQVKSVLPLNYGIGMEDAYVTLELARLQHPRFISMLEKFCADNKLVHMSDAVNRKFGTAVVTCSRVDCFFNNTATWGWTGDPRDITTRSCNTVLEDEWYLQLVCIDARHTTNKQSDTSRGFARIASTQWASLGVVKQTLERAARGIVEKMAISHSTSLKQRFTEFYQEAQIQLNTRAANTFGPIEHVAKQHDMRMGGYVLLQCVSAKTPSYHDPHGRAPKRVRLVIEDTEGEANATMYAGSRGIEIDAADTDVLFEVVAGTLETTTGDTVDRLTLPPPIMGVLTESNIALFQSEQSNTLHRLASVVSQRHQLRDELRFRLHTIDREPNIKENETEIQSYDRNSLPFEYDLRCDSDAHFIQEFTTFVEIVAQCIIATVPVPSFNERAIPFQPQPLDPASDEYARGMAVVKQLNISLDRGEENPSKVHLYTIDIASTVKKAKFARLVNNWDPWVHPTDRHVGACASLIWQPSVDLATNIRTEPIAPETMYRALTTVTPFGSMQTQQAELTQHIARAAKDSIHKAFMTDKSRCVLKQADVDVAAPEYELLVLDYGIRVTTTPDDTTPQVSWSLGSSASMIMEAVEMCLVFLQLELLKIDQDPLHENNMAHIQARERDANIDTYPMGMMTPSQCKYAQCGRPTLPDTAAWLPGQPNFYRHRDYAYKEVQYADSLFDVQHLDTLSTSKSPPQHSQNRWSGMCGVFAPATPRTGSTILLASETTPETMGLSSKWSSHPLTPMPSCTGTGIWQGSDPLTLNTVLQDRYRAYAGTRPRPQASLHDLEKDTHIQHAADMTGPLFNTDEENVKIIHPAIKATDMLKQRLPEFLSQRFVGWHFSNERALNRTVFAVACGPFYDKIVSFFNVIDPIYKEPRGINILAEPRTAEMSFISIVLSGIPSRTLSELKCPPIVPAVVLVKDAVPTSVATMCNVTGFYVKTSAFRLIETEVWSTISNIMSEVRRPPDTAITNNIYAQITRNNKQRRGTYTIQHLLQMRPSCAIVLARLFIAIAIYDSTRRNHTSYRRTQNVNAGMAHLEPRICSVLTIYQIYMVCLYTGVQDIRTSTYEVLFHV
jgi:hypothetical protein